MVSLDSPSRMSLAREHLLSFSDAVKSLPTVSGRRLAPSTLYRWARRGIGGGGKSTCWNVSRWLLGACAFKTLPAKAPTPQHRQPADGQQHQRRRLRYAPAGGAVVVVPDRVIRLIHEVVVVEVAIGPAAD